MSGEGDRAADQLEQAILDLLAGRAGTICPSEAARRVAPDNWRPLMEATRAAGRRLAARGAIRILAGGKPVEVDHAGPIRFARPAN